MKHFFKYGSGYINIDDKNLYFTKTGNWQEARQLTEQKSKKALQQRKIIIWIVYLLFIVGSVWLHSYFTLVVATVLIGVNNLYRKGDAFKIPLYKLNKVERAGSNAVVYYTDKAGEPAKVTLKKVTDSDYQTLCSLLTEE